MRHFHSLLLGSLIRIAGHYYLPAIMNDLHTTERSKFRTEFARAYVRTSILHGSVRSCMFVRESKHAHAYVRASECAYPILPYKKLTSAAIWRRNQSTGLLACICAQEHVCAHTHFRAIMRRRKVLCLTSTSLKHFVEKKYYVLQVRL